MPVIVNEVRKGTYFDSVVLMRLSRMVAALPEVIECGMMMATPANKRIMTDAGVLAAAGAAAGPGDLVIAISARDQASADAALVAARAAIDQPKTSGGDGNAWAPRSIRAAVQADPAANIALISVPGAFAVAEARKALSRGLNVLMFSDNVAIEDERELKLFARAQGLLMMGPDCGTAIIGGVPLAFANVVPRGDIGIIGASGTGIQEVSCLIANHGGGISHAIGTGGRDLKKEIGGITTLMAIDLLDADPATRHIVIISKPPAADVANLVLERIGRSAKTFTVCFLGGTDLPMPANATATATLRGAADVALGQELQRWSDRGDRRRSRQAHGLLVRGLFAGGTLCAEAQTVFLRGKARVSSNAPIAGAVNPLVPGTHILLDLGDDAYTQGRPHPMIEPAVRTPQLEAALNDPSVGVVLFDIVLGYGGHSDPAAEIVAALARHGATEKSLVASICGTRGDPQRYDLQAAALRTAGVAVFDAMSDAAMAALALVGGGDA